MNRVALYLVVLLSIFQFGCGSNSNSTVQSNPPPGITSFAHIVVIIQENRTTDNLFQSMAAYGADVSPKGVCFNGSTPCSGTDSNAMLPLTAVPLVTSYGFDNGNRCWLTAYDSGKMDQFNACCAGTDCPVNGGYEYVQASDIQPYIQLAQTYAFADRMFQTNQGPSLPAHMYLSWGTTRLGSESTVLGYGNSTGYCAFPSSGPGTWPTIDQQTGITGTGTACVEYSNLITDQLESKGLTWKYYIATQNSEFFWWAPAYINHICCGVKSPLACPSTQGCQAAEYANHVAGSPEACPGNSCSGQILTDIANCTLPNVAWVTPSTLSSDLSKVSDGSGPSWVAAIVNAVGTSTCTTGNWNDTAILLLWDDWGGHYDHVSPNIQAGYAGLPPALNSAYPIPQSAGPTTSYNTDMYGFRVPLLAISKYAQPGVSHVTHDFGSILTFIEHNFGLSQMGDASSGTTSTTWNADGLAAARGDYLLDMFNFNGNIGFTSIARLEHFSPIDAPLPTEWFLAAMPKIKYPAIDTDLDDEPLRGADLAKFEQFREHNIRIVRAAIREQQTGIKRLRLQQSLSSRMPSGTTFTATDIVGRIFTGHIITQPVERGSGIASLKLVFDGPVTILKYGGTSQQNAQPPAQLLTVGSFSAGNRIAGPSDKRTENLVRSAGDGLISPNPQREARLRKGQVIVVKIAKKNLT